MADDIASLDKNRVAVAKFKNICNEATHFGTFLAEKLTTSLIQVSKARYSVMERVLVDRFIGERTDITAEEARNLLEAGIIVSGTYTVLGEEVELNARAINLTTGIDITARALTIPLEEVRSLLRNERCKKPLGKKESDLTLNLQVLASKHVGGKEREVVVENGDTLYSGDKFKVNFEMNQDCYLYVLYYSSRGRPHVLFPNPKIALDNEIEGGIPYSLPGDDLTFYLDQNTGVETLYFVASLELMNDVTTLLNEMQKAGGSSENKIYDELKDTMRAKDIGITYSNAPSIFGDRDRVMEVVKGQGSLLKVFEILHR
jgi:TolB-like protein